jgi:hypothetical protein
MIRLLIISPIGAGLTDKINTGHALRRLGWILAHAPAFWSSRALEYLTVSSIMNFLKPKPNQSITYLLPKSTEKWENYEKM